MKSHARAPGPGAIVAFLAPTLFGMLMFSLIPLASSFALSLSDWSGLERLAPFQGVPAFIGFGNYIDIFTGQEFWRVLGNTLYFIVLYIPLILPVSLLVARLLHRELPGITSYRVLYYIPVLTSWVAGALIWKWVLSPVYGPVNAVLEAVGIPGPGWLTDRNWAMPAIVLASIWKDMGFFGMIFLGGLQGINTTYYEAAAIDGAGPLRRFFRITLPLLSPVTFFVVIISIINSFQLFPQVMIMTENAGPSGATQVMVERIYKYAFRYHEMSYATAFSWVLFAIILVFTLVQLRLQKRWVHYDR